jgi:hypothetical protein
MTITKNINLFEQIRVLKFNRHYRIGDLILAGGMRWLIDRETILSDPKYKDSILFKYLKTIDINSSQEKNWKSLISILKKIKKPSKNNFCIHIRCGDIATDNQFHKNCFIFNRDRLMHAIDNFLDSQTSSITIVAAMHYGSNDLLNNRYSYTDHNYSVNKEIMNNILYSIEQEFKLPINIFQTSSDDIKFIDESFLELVFSDKCILDNGGFGHCIRHVRNHL